MRRPDPAATSMDAIDERREVLRLFGDTVGHDVQNLLLPVGTALELLAGAANQDPAEARLIAIALDNLAQVRRFCAEAVACSRWKPHLERGSIAAIVAAAVESQRERAEAKRVAIETKNLAGEVHTDHATLVRIVEALLANAIDAAPDGTSVSVSASQPETGVLITVTDRGAGIAPEAQEQVFRPFFTSKRGRDGGPRGFGLGLASAQLFVRQLGGGLWFESNGEGFSFYVRLPERRG